MFRAASRRISASIPQLLQPQRQTTARSICNNTTRPSPQAKIHNSNITPSARVYGQRYSSYSHRLRMGYREASKDIFRKNPIVLPLAILSAVGGIIFFVWTSYVEVTKNIPQYTKFPPKVADALRQAIYYTDIDLNAPKALNAYKNALSLAIEEGMHPFSDEVLGLKIQVAAMLEKAGLVKQATEVLERTKNEALTWVEEGQRMESSTVTKASLTEAQLSSDANVAADNVQINKQALEDAEKELKAMQEFEARQRERALKKVIGINMKLAELYASDYMQDDKKAEAAQVAAVELCLKEMHRRQKLGLPVGASSSEGADSSWMNLTEIATALTDLATVYTERERHELAMPLYLRALDIIRAEEGNSVSCKQVVLLNSVSSAMAGQAQPTSPRVQQMKQQGISQDPTVEAARQWAQKAIDVAAHIKPPIRDEECDLTCVAASYNLGELAELQQKPDTAIAHYTEAKNLAKKLGYQEGVSVADDALKRLKKRIL
ncbi:uncharacterized protein N7469_008010 [Penicillium citrinum]|uniref:TPR domain protein n=1 Tax=Penicillium citrinum TaxID=5077 RepID=A0A9W9TIX0_PENCI|nr:uncharacterized protein N7469_008010 [Penicillium citrinum]KAJ5224507.1 hypothetical protein N7469_008010 [Penicillium citrinum]KAK5796055.1 hypothetical protein VI817_005340 [Penicillium citrinum]